MKIRVLKLIPLFVFSIAIGLRFSGGALEFAQPFLMALIAVVVKLFSSKIEFLTVRRFENAYLILITTFCLFIFLSLIWTNSFSYGLNKVIFLFFWIFGFFVFSKDIVENFHYFIFFLFVSFTIILVAFFIKFGSPLEISRNITKFYRLGDEETNPITFSRFFGVGIISSFFLLRFWAARKVKFIILFPISLALFYMFISGSKGPLVSLLIAFVVLFSTDLKFFVKKYLQYITVILTCTFLFISSQYFNYYSSFLEQRFLNSENSYSTRLERYDVVFRNIDYASTSDLSLLLIGSGSGNYSYVLTGQDIVSFPHNIFLEIIFEFGLLGLFLFTLIVLFPAIKIFFGNITSKGKYLLALWVFLLMNSMFSGDISHNFLLFGFSILLATYLYMKEKMLLAQNFYI